jgi:hypothetical protein
VIQITFVVKLNIVPAYLLVFKELNEFLSSNKH